jgi:hypothetical protein
VTLDWVYIDEGRLVLGVVVESVPSGLVVDMPIITADRSLKPDLGFNSLLAAEDTGQIVFLAFNPVRADDYTQQVDFSVDLPLVEDGDSHKTPLAMFHYDLEGIPIYKGQTHEIGQAVYQNGFEGIPIDKNPTDKIEKTDPNDLEFEMESILVTPSFTEVEFCVNLSAEEVMALPRSDISLKIGDKPVVSDYLVLEISETGDQTCLRLGFLDGGSLENDLVVFRFTQWSFAMMQYSPDKQIEGFQNMIIKP